MVAGASGLSVFTVDANVTATIWAWRSRAAAERRSARHPGPVSTIGGQRDQRRRRLQQRGVVVDEDVVAGNVVPTGGTNAPASGGGVYSAGSLHGDEASIAFSANSADFGGEAIPAARGSCRSRAARWDHRAASRATGRWGGWGRLHNDSGLGVTITTTAISGNSATASGGGIDNSGTGTLTVSGGSMIGNSAGGSGGGIENTATLTVETKSSSRRTRPRKGAAASTTRAR